MRRTISACRGGILILPAFIQRCKSSVSAESPSGKWKEKYVDSIRRWTALTSGPESVAPNQGSVKGPNRVAAFRGVHGEQEHFLPIHIHHAPLVGQKFAGFAVNDHP